MVFPPCVGEGVAVRVDVCVGVNVSVELEVGVDSELDPQADKARIAVNKSTNRSSRPVFFIFPPE